MIKKISILMLSLVVFITTQELRGKIVSTEWLAANLSKENHRIIDV